MTERTPWSMSRLTCAIRAVRDAPHDSDGATKPLLDLSEDIGILEWMCRLTPIPVLDVMDQTPDAPLYGPGSIDPSILSSIVPGMPTVSEEAARRAIRDPASWGIVRGDDPSPIPMRLCCEGCGKLHVDEGELATRPHHTHSCQHCGLTWRPAVCRTVGVRYLPGFRDEPSDPTAPPFGGSAGRRSPTVGPTAPPFGGAAVSSGGSPAATGERQVTDSQFKVSLIDGFLPKSLTDIIRRLPRGHIESIAECALRIFQSRNGIPQDARYGTIVQEGDPSWVAAIVQACRTHGIPCGDDGEVAP